MKAYEMTNMSIDLTAAEIKELAGSYAGQDGDAKLADLMSEAVRRGHMQLDDLVAVAKWKWRGSRTCDLVKLNKKNDVEEATKISFSTTSERLKIGALLSLSGVQWPMASVILHFAFPSSYPILDVRAMASVKAKPNYSFSMWLAYTDLCRSKACELNVSMRDLDRALWAANKHNEVKLTKIRKKRNRKVGTNSGSSA